MASVETSCNRVQHITPSPPSYQHHRPLWHPNLRYTRSRGSGTATTLLRSAHSEPYFGSAAYTLSSSWVGFGLPRHHRNPQRQYRTKHRLPNLRRLTNPSILRFRNSSTSSRPTNPNPPPVAPTATPSPHHPLKTRPLPHNHRLQLPTHRHHGSPSANPPRRKTSLRLPSYHHSRNPFFPPICHAGRLLTRPGPATGSVVSETQSTGMVTCVLAVSSGTIFGSVCA